jgi:antitoxin HigA-1
MTEHELAPISPGEILRHEFMEPLDLTEDQLARELDLPVGQISDVVQGKGGVTAEMALRLEKYFGVSAQFWLNLQSRHDLKVARRDVGPAIEARVRTRRSA